VALTAEAGQIIHFSREKSILRLLPALAWGLLRIDPERSLNSVEGSILRLPPAVALGTLKVEPEQSRKTAYEKGINLSLVTRRS